MSPSTTSMLKTRTRLRRVRAVLIAAPAALALAALVSPPAAFADEVIQGCTVLESPTQEVHTICRNMDLSGIDLSGRQMQYADFTGSDLSDANMSGSDWYTVTFTGTNLARASFTGNATAINANFDDANLTGADLTAFSWGGSSAQRSKLVNAKMADGRVYYVNLTGADLTGADLVRANFDGGTVTGANFTKTVLMPPDQQLPDATAGTTVEWTVPPGLGGAGVTGCSPESGSAFPTGVTTVRCTVAGTNGEGFGTFTVTIGRVAPPSGGSSGSSSGSSAGDLFGGIFG